MSLHFCVLYGILSHSEQNSPKFVGGSVLVQYGGESIEEEFVINEPDSTTNNIVFGAVSCQADTNSVLNDSIVDSGWSRFRKSESLL